MSSTATAGPAVVSRDLSDAFRREAGGLLGFFLRRGASADDAADLISETFLAAWRSSRTAEVEPEMLRAWLYGIARKTLSRYRRGRIRRSELGDRLRATLAVELTQPAIDAEESERAERIRSLVLELPAIDREIVRLVYWDGLTQEEVAVVLGKRATAIRARLSRARRALRDRLDG